MSSSNSKFAFFKQSGWMIFATFFGGIFMTLVHSVASKMAASEYALFGALLGCFVMLGVPAAGLQTVFAQQAAAAIDGEHKRELIAVTRAVLRGTFFFWLISGVIVLTASKPISALLKISNPVALWLTVVLVLPTLWLPIIRGLLQGQHHFAGMGWLQILDGMGRISAMVAIVLVFKGQAAGGMLAALIGNLLAITTGAWLTRNIWMSKDGGKFSWKPWLERVIPLTFGAGAIILMSSIDRVFVQSIFPDTTINRIYVGGTLTGFAIIQFISPVTIVMFPKIVQSQARKEKSNALALTVLVTGVFGAMAAIGCTILPWLPVHVIYFTRPEIWPAEYLVPWFAWGLLPLMMANVLIQNLMAKKVYKASFWLFLVPVIYATTLVLVSPTLLKMDQLAAFKLVAQILGLSCLLLFIVAAWFSFRAERAATGQSASTPKEQATSRA